VFKEWKSLAVLFGGSANAVKALRLGMTLSRQAGYPLMVFTRLEGHDRSRYDEVIQDNGLEEAVKHWTVFDKGDFKINLYEVPHDALVVLGAYGHGLIKELAFRSKMETIQSVLPNSMLVVGPECSG
jgi:hypothetical protein